MVSRRALGQGRRLEAREVERQHLDARVALEGVREDAEVPGVEVGRQEELTSDEISGEASDSGADLENALPEPGGQLLEHPLVVSLGPRQAEQGLVAGVGVLLVVDERVPEDRPEGDEPVPPANLLPFPVGPARVGDRHLEDPCAHLGELGGDLRLHAEPVRADGDALDDVGAEDLVAGLHVGEVHVRDHVGDERQQLVGDVVPEVEHAAGGARESRPVDHVRLAFKDRREEPRVVAWIVLEVRVLDQHDVAGRLGKAPAQSGALALVGLLVEDPDLVLLVHGPEPPRRDELGLQPAQVLPRPIRRAIVDDDDLLGDGDGLDAIEDLGEGETLVVDGDDDGQSRGADSVPPPAL